MSEEQLPLPYEEILPENLAFRQLKRENLFRGNETYFIPFHFLYEREGWNPRVEYNEIPELAEKIRVNGLTTLTVDYLNDGRAIVEKGHRRLRALKLLHESRTWPRENLPGIRSDGTVECFINSREVTELDRIKNALSDNDSLQLSPVEQGDCIWRMKYVWKLDTDQIRNLTGLSRQHIDNRLLLAEQSPRVKEFIRLGYVKPTNVTQLARVVKTPEKVEDLIEGMVAQNKTLRGSDIKDIQRKEQQEQDEPDDFEDTGREEIDWCNEVIRNADKINSIVDKIENEQMKGDINQRVEWIQRTMEKVREYVKTHKKK